MKNLFYLLLLVSTVYMQSCISYTRTEVDEFTITQRDTVFTHQEYNSPGNRDGGTIHPSNRDILNEQETVQYDSIVERDYPDWVRYGLYESIGITGGDNKRSLGSGPLGIHPNLFRLLDPSNEGEEASLFTGTITRLGIFDKRLRWFRDAPNWSFGVTALEIISPDAKFENTLIGIATPYLKKKWFFREKIPFVSLTASVGISPWGAIANSIFDGFSLSYYMNTSLSLDIGSMGGLNFRTYVGYAFGINSENTAQIKSNELLNDPIIKESGNTISLPYFGFGVSFLDFVATPDEHIIEYKDMPQSAWNVGLFQFSALATNSDVSFFNTLEYLNAQANDLKEGTKTAEEIKNRSSVIKGMQFRLLPVSLAIPINDNYKFYAGTSLMSGIFLGSAEGGFGFLPIRVGYWHTLLQDELTVEPFMEYIYYPSTVFNIGAKVNLRISEKINFGIILGYVNGTMFSSDDLKLGNIDLDIFEDFGDFSAFYVGISMGVWDKIFFEQDLRYKK